MLADGRTEHAKELLAPITLGCKTKVAKIIGISIAALQWLVALGGVPTVSPTLNLECIADWIK